jgi:hypothetical protein
MTKWKGTTETFIKRKVEGEINMLIEKKNLKKRPNCQNRMGTRIHEKRK